MEYYKIKKNEQYRLKMDVLNQPQSIINTLRRIMLSEIPTFTLGQFDVETNTSVLYNEFTTHRLELIPVFSEITEVNPTVTFTLDKKCDDQVLHILSKDIKII